MLILIEVAVFFHIFKLKLSHLNDDKIDASKKFILLLARTILLLQSQSRPIILIFLEENHKIIMKTFQTEMYLIGNSPPLNNFAQESLVAQ
jgi:hypothetical protein